MYLLDYVLGMDESTPTKKSSKIYSTGFYSWFARRQKLPIQGERLASANETYRKQHDSISQG